MNRRQIAPELAPDAVCCHCGQPAVDQWWPGVCALRGAVKLEWMPVCAACDVQLNEDYVRFLFGHRHDGLLLAYRRAALPLSLQPLEQPTALPEAPASPSPQSAAGGLRVQPQPGNT